MHRVSGKGLFILLVLGVLWVSACKPAWAQYPLLVGGEAHGRENIRILKQLGLGNFVWIPAKNYPMGNTPWDDSHGLPQDVDACLEQGFYFMITQRRGLGDAMRPGGYTYGGHCSGEIWPRPTLKPLLERAGRFCVGLHAEELDADLVQNASRPVFAARSPGLYQYDTRAGSRRSFEAELNRLKCWYHGWGAAFLPSLCVTHQLSGFRIGALRGLDGGNV